jgi:general secretion pathway protein A
MAVIGDIGTGKTTLCRALGNKLDSNVDTSVIFNPMLSVIELLKAINDDFGNPRSLDDTVKGQIDALNEFLLRRLRWKKNAVVIVDEAQHLSVEALEMLRLLSNLETENKKLLQFVFLGQKELEIKLRSGELRQLNQRISIRYLLGALNYSEMIKYITHRVMIAGGQGSVQFEEKAAWEIFCYSDGVPRVINCLCDRALLLAYADKTKFITKKIVKRAMADIEGLSNVAGVKSLSGRGRNIFRGFFRCQ